MHGFEETVTKLCVKTLLKLNISLHMCSVTMYAACYIYATVDNDECRENNGGCDQICINTPGSYQCLCINGFFLTHDKRTCQGFVIMFYGNDITTFNVK